jgi:hypothetical protein
MTPDDVISSLNVIKYYNPNMRSLYDTWVKESGQMSLTQPAVDQADEEGRPIYETLATVQIGLANCIHDYIYNIIHPFDSVSVKNTIREQMCRDLFGLESEF